MNLSVFFKQTKTADLWLSAGPKGEHKHNEQKILSAGALSCLLATRNWRKRYVGGAFTALSQRGSETERKSERWRWRWRGRGDVGADGPLIWFWCCNNTQGIS